MCSIGPSRCLRAEPCVRRTVQRGWRSTASICGLYARVKGGVANYYRRRLNIALELAKHNPVYEDIASKFFEVRPYHVKKLNTSLTFTFQHFIFISDAMTYKEGDNEQSLWNEQDGMYYDAIQFESGHTMQLPVRSLVGLIPLYATLVLEPSVINRLPGFKKRMEWFIENRPEIAERNMANMKGAFFP